jgi:hypothetical protein
MATTEKKIRVTAYLEPVVFRVLGAPLTCAGASDALTALADLVMARTAMLADMLNPDDWEYLMLALEDVCEDSPRDGETWVVLVGRAVAEAKTLRGLDKEVWPQETAACWAKFKGKLRCMSDLDAYAVICAVRWYFNQHVEGFQDEGWWDVGLRVRPVAEGRASRGGSKP